MKLTPKTYCVSTDFEQKQKLTVNGRTLFIVPNRGMYNPNGRETNAVLATVEATGSQVPLNKGDVVVLHHNSTTEEIYRVGELSVLTYDRWTLATVDANGELIPTPENLVCKRIKKPDQIGEYVLPDSAVKYYSDQVQDLATGNVIGIMKWGDYEVVYNWQGEERRRIIVYKQHTVCRIMEVI